MKIVSRAMVFPRDLENIPYVYSHSIVLIECNELIYLHKILFVLKTSAGRTVRCA